MRIEDTDRQSGSPSLHVAAIISSFAGGRKGGRELLPSIFGSGTAKSIIYCSQTWPAGRPLSGEGRKEGAIYQTADRLLLFRTDCPTGGEAGRRIVHLHTGISRKQPFFKPLVACESCSSIQDKAFPYSNICSEYQNATTMRRFSHTVRK